MADNLGGSVVHRYMYVPHDPLVLDQKFSTLWNGMNAALIAQDKPTALTYLSSIAADKYGPAFDVLMPDYASFVSALSPLTRSSLAVRIVEYAINNTEDGGNDLHFLYFVRGIDGVWRLESF